jgi:DNA-binding response OmpR family regulator
MAKILIVEDNLQLALLLKQCLVRDFHLVEVAHTATDAAYYLRSCFFDLVILDWVLPDGTGVDVLQDFRANGGKTPTLMISHKAGVSDTVSGLNAGCDDYLPKPFNTRELSARVRALLRRPVDFCSDATMQVGEIVLNSATHQVTYKGSSVKLLPLEFSLLQFFLKHPNKIWSKEALIHHVWPNHCESSTEAVKTYIKYLRKKFDRNAEQPLIQTIHGVGYIFHSPVR